nr:hypothetical protein [uncultured Porphyromonas sp.]
MMDKDTAFARIPATLSPLRAAVGTGAAASSQPEGSRSRQGTSSVLDLSALRDIRQKAD